LIIEFLQTADRGRADGGGDAGRPEAVAQHELFVLALEVEDLEQAAAGLFDDGGAGGAGFGVGGHHGGGAAAQTGEAGLQGVDQTLVTFEQRLVGDALVLFQEAVLLESELVEVITNLEMFAEEVRHGKAGKGDQEVTAGSAGGGGAPG
jgi:hypothetical protein